jgi:hypothetical protein
MTTGSDAEAVCQKKAPPITRVADRAGDGRADTLTFDQRVEVGEVNNINPLRATSATASALGLQLGVQIDPGEALGGCRALL